MGARFIGQGVGQAQLLTFDMGGTSTDVALCPGEPQIASSSEIDGLPVRAQLLDIETIGAGGGSIAWVDEGAPVFGLLKWKRSGQTWELVGPLGGAR